MSDNFQVYYIFNKSTEPRNVPNHRANFQKENEPKQTFFLNPTNIEQSKNSYESILLHTSIQHILVIPQFNTCFTFAGNSD
jgi:hypothetical protein